MDWKILLFTVVCSVAVCFATKESVVLGKISFIGKKLDKIPKGSCMSIKIQDAMIADASSVDISSKILKGNELQLEDGAMVYNITFPQGGRRGQYTVSATLNMGWCPHGGNDWLHGGDYLTMTSFDFNLKNKNTVYKMDIEMEYYETIELKKSHNHHRHDFQRSRKEEDPCYHAPCINSICTSFANGSYMCSKIERLPCAVPMCAAVYEPVCGSNGKTYSNECLLDSDSCIHGIKIDLYKAHDGECYSKHSMHEGFLLVAAGISLATLGLVAVFLIWRRNRLIKLQRMSPYGKEKVAPLGL